MASLQDRGRADPVPFRERINRIPSSVPRKERECQVPAASFDSQPPSGFGRPLRAGLSAQSPRSPTRCGLPAAIPDARPSPQFIVLQHAGLPDRSPARQARGLKQSGQGPSDEPCPDHSRPTNTCTFHTFSTTSLFGPTRMRTPPTVSQRSATPSDTNANHVSNPPPLGSTRSKVDYLEHNTAPKICHSYDPRGSKRNKH